MKELLIFCVDPEVVLRRTNNQNLQYIHTFQVETRDYVLYETF